jgi:hypothetical protein
MMSSIVVDRKDSFWYAFIVHDRKAPYVLFRHGLQGFVDFIFWLASDYVCCGDLSDRKVSRQAVSGSYSDCDIPVRDNSMNLPVVPDDGQHSAVVHPKKFNCVAHVGVSVATDS